MRLQAWRRALGIAGGAWAFLAAVSTGLAYGTVGVLPFAVLPRGRRERYAMVTAQAWARTVVRHVLQTRVTRTGTWSLPADQGAVIFCNHRSWLDPLLLMSETRSNGLSKREIFWIPVIGLYGHLAGAIFFDRRDLEDRHRARREVMRLVSGGHRVQVFPEGTRSRDGELHQRVYLTTAFDAWERGLPVVPCAVYGTERVLPPHTPAAFLGQEVRLDIGEPLRPADYPSAQAFAEACWAEVVARFERLRAEDELTTRPRSRTSHLG